MLLSWIPTVYAMLLSACLTLAVVHLLVWHKVRQAPYNLLFSLGSSINLAAMIFLELQMINAATPGDFAEALRWLHVPIWFFFLLTIGFVHFHLRAGRRWLALAAAGIRTLALVANFLSELNLNYRAIERLEVVPFLGDNVVVAIGTPNPWMLLGTLSVLLVTAFFIDAMVDVWRRGERSQALIFGSGMGLFILLPTISGALIVLGILQWAPLIGIFYAPVVAAMSHQLSRDLVRTHWLHSQLQVTDAELRLSETRLKLAAESARLAVWEWRPESDQLWTTEAGVAIFGVPPATPVSMALFYSTVPPDDLEELQQAIQRSYKLDEPHIRDYRVVLPDGGIRWIASRGRFDPRREGEERVMRGVVFDVTDAKLAEARFRRVVEVSPIGKLISDLQGHILFANPMAEAYFGYSSQELGELAIDALLPEHAACRDGAGETTDNGRDVFGRRKDGSTIPLQMNVSRLPSAGEVMLLTTLVDISERKEREEQLWRDKNFLRQVIDSNPCHIFVKDGDSRYTLVNRNVADMFGLAPRDLIGKTIGELGVAAVVAERLQRDDRSVIDTRQELIVGEENLVDARGQERLFHTIKRPILDRDGQRLLVLGVSTDITARKQAELEIERQRNELAHLSRITMLSELSGSLAHELNQPLAAILANAQAAQRFLAKVPPNLAEVRDILGDIIEDDRHAGGVIQGLRLLLKKGEMRQDRLDINDAVHSVLKLVRSDLLNARVSVRTKLNPQLPGIRGDRVQLQQVLINLVVNASEAMSAMPQDSRLLDISSAVAADGGVEVRVCDSGRGLSDVQMEHLFTPFYSTKEHGLGIGLAVCQRIIEAHGGELLATNNPAGGACFRFTLPACTGNTA